jgi:hypothetical protein
MSTLTPLIELAHQRSLDLFFRAGQGYMAGSVREFGQKDMGHGLSPLGVQIRAKERIVCALREIPPAAQPYARPGS